MKRELDRRVAIEVYGTEVVSVKKNGWGVDYCAVKVECNSPIYSDCGVEAHHLKYYSTNIKDAFELLNFVQKNTDPLGREWKPTLSYQGFKSGWRVGFELSDSNSADDITHFYGEGETAELAIVNAVLTGLKELTEVGGALNER